MEFFTVSKSYSMPGWRVGFCVGNPDLVGGLTTIKGYMDYGIFAPNQLAAATALTACDADVAANRALYRHRADVLVQAMRDAGWPMTRAPRRPCSSGPRSLRVTRRWARVAFASELLEKAGVAVAPGVGFGKGGEGYVRFSLIESDDRVRQAGAAIKKVRNC